MQPKDQRRADPRYQVIPRTLIFITRGEDVLLLMGAVDKKLWAGKYNGLGGHIEPNETPLQSARRELLEETGLEVPALTLRGIVHITMPQPPGIVIFVFVGEYSGGKVRPSEEGTPRWIPWREIPNVPMVEDLPKLLPRVLTPGPLVFAHYAFNDDGLEMTFEPR